MTISVTQLIDQSPSVCRTRVDEFKRYMQHLRTYRAGLQSLADRGIISESIMDNSFDDYLNETSGLFIDEYLQLEYISVEYWDEEFSESVNGGNCHDYGSIANITRISTIIADIREIVSQLVVVQESINDLEEKCILTGEDACDLFGDTVYSYGLDYGSYVELQSVTWVQVDD